MDKKIIAFGMMSLIVLLTACGSGEKLSEKNQVDVEQSTENINTGEITEAEAYEEYQVGELKIVVPNILCRIDEGESGMDAYIDFRINDQNEGNIFSVWVDYDVPPEKTLKEYVDTDLSIVEPENILSEETYVVNGVEVNETEYVYTVAGGEGIIKGNQKIFLHNGNAYKFWYGAALEEFNENELAIVDGIFEKALQK